MDLYFHLKGRISWLVYSNRIVCKILYEPILGERYFQITHCKDDTIIFAHINFPPDYDGNSIFYIGILYVKET